MAKKRTTKSLKPAARVGRAARANARGAQRKERTSRSVRRRVKGAFRSASCEQLPRYAGVASLLRLPVHSDIEAAPVDVLLSGVPFDGGVNHRPGARLGPRAVREASATAKSFSSALGVDIFDELQVADGGDIATGPGNLEQALGAMATRAEAVARSGIVGGYVGGDQTTTLGVLRGIRRAKLKPLGLVHFDAHTNTLGALSGRCIHHESVVRNAVEEGIVVAERSIQVGIRGPFAARDELAFPFAKHFEIATTDEVKWDLHSVVSQVRKVLRQGPVYVTVDVSVLDPAYAPGTGCPTPGGLDVWELQQLLRALVGGDIVGFDVVEIAPAYDPAGVTGLVGVTVLQEILCAIADTRRSARAAASSRRGRGRVSA